MRPTTRRRRDAVAVAVGVIVLTLVAACSGGTAANTATTANSTYIFNLYTGATGQFVENFNPFAPSPTHGTLGMIFEPLMFFNQAKANDVAPLLATKYEFTDQGKTLTFTLREGVKWSDGQPFTADDVAFNFTYRATNPKLNSAGTRLVTATATDATHVVLKYSEPQYVNLWRIAGQTWMVPKHVWESVAEPLTANGTKPVGTGPFTEGTFSPQQYVLTKNTTYWEPGKPKIAGLRYWSFTSNDAATAALGAGQLDWAGLFIPDIDKQYVGRDATNNKYVNNSFLYLTNLIPNLTRAPLNDLAVRQAINVALDRNKIIKLAFSGYGTQPSQAEAVVPLFNDFVSPKYKDTTIPYDAARATSTLDAAGYTKGSDGIYAKNGKRLSFTIKVITGWSDYISALQIITEELKAVGIEMKTQEGSYQSVVADQASGDFDMVIWNGWGGPSPYFMYNNLLNSKSVPPASQNLARWTNATVDAALATIAATPPDQLDTLKREFSKIQDEVVGQLPYIPLQQSSALAEFRTVNATGWPTADNPYALGLPFSNPDNGIVAKNITPTK